MKKMEIPIVVEINAGISAWIASEVNEDIYSF